MAGLLPISASIRSPALRIVRPTRWKPPSHLTSCSKRIRQCLIWSSTTPDQFPPEYKGHAFVALKGSWNRSEPTGYKVVRVPFKDGKPEGFYENFMTGFWASGERRAEVWGRPAALAVMKDGSLLVGDDTGGTIWRVSYTGSQKTQ